MKFRNWVAYCTKITTNNNSNSCLTFWWTLFFFLPTAYFLFVSSLTGKDRWLTYKKKDHFNNMIRWVMKATCVFTCFLRLILTECFKDYKIALQSPHNAHSKYLVYWSSMTQAGVGWLRISPWFISNLYVVT